MARSFDAATNLACSGSSNGVFTGRVAVSFTPQGATASMQQNTRQKRQRIVGPDHLH
jgi:hypothetical protein